MTDRYDTPESIEAAFIRQEHRWWAVIRNLLVNRKQFPKGDPRRRATSIAALALFLSPAGAAAGGVTAVSIAAVYLAWKANELLQGQNALLQAQNDRIELQNEQIALQSHLLEGDRRSGLAFEVTSILDKIYKEVNRASSDESKVEVSPVLIGRIVAVSRALRPYRYMDEDGKLMSRPLSPERGQLLISLFTSGISMEQVYLGGASFSRADLREYDFAGADLACIDLAGSDLRQANLSGVDLRGADLSGADLRQAKLSQAIFGAFDWEVQAEMPPCDEEDGELPGRYEFLRQLEVPPRLRRTGVPVSFENEIAPGDGPAQGTIHRVWRARTRLDGAVVDGPDWSRRETFEAEPRSRGWEVREEGGKYIIRKRPAASPPVSSTP